MTYDLYENLGYSMAVEYFMQVGELLVIFLFAGCTILEAYSSKALDDA